MKKIIIPTGLVVVLLCVVGFTIFLNSRNNKKELTPINNIEEKPKLEEKEKIEEIQEEVVDNEEVINKEPEKTNDVKPITTQPKEKVETPKKDTTSKTESPKTETPTPKVEEEKPKEPTAWERLGISEYDYYNKPMWSWARVDYSIKTYGSQANARAKCIEDGEASQKAYACDSINSYSGDYLGEMLNIEN